MLSFKLFTLTLMNFQNFWKEKGVYQNLMNKKTALICHTSNEYLIFHLTLNRHEITGIQKNYQPIIA